MPKLEYKERKRNCALCSVSPISKLPTFLSTIALQLQIDYGVRGWKRMSAHTKSLDVRISSRTLSAPRTHTANRTHAKEQGKYIIFLVRPCRGKMRTRALFSPTDYAFSGLLRIQIPHLSDPRRAIRPFLLTTVRSRSACRAKSNRSRRCERLSASRPSAAAPTSHVRAPKALHRHLHQHPCGVAANRLHFNARPALNAAPTASPSLW